MFWVLKYFSIINFIIVNVLFNSVTGTSDDNLLSSSLNSLQERLTHSEPDAEKPCFIVYYEKKQEAGRCVYLSKNTRGCVSESYIDLSHLDCLQKKEIIKQHTN